ncbi:unnamed protein product, partial [Hymenolepis diminuta]
NDSQDDVTIFAHTFYIIYENISILKQIQEDEEYINSLYQFIQDGFVKCWKKVPMAEVKQFDEIDVSADTISEIEKALAKADIAYEKFVNSKQSKSSSRKIKQKNQSAIKSENFSSVQSSQKAKTKSQSLGSLPKTSNTKSISTATINPIRQGRVHSEAVILRKRAKSWLPKVSGSFQESAKRSLKSQSVAEQTELSPCIYNSNKSNSSITLELNETTLKRVKDVVALSRSMETYAEEALISFKDQTAQKDFLNYCENLLYHDPSNVELPRHFFSHNLPELTLLFDQFTKIYEVIDWSIATPRQHHWRCSMLKNFSALFNIAESFKPIVIERSETFNTISHDKISDETFPSLETLWKAYVCTGRELPSSYADPPVEIPSRRCRLALGSAIFPNTPKSRQDFEEMLDFWVEIFHLQRRLQILEFVEKQLPHWLRFIANQPSEKASTLRLLCQIACDCFPVAVVSK